MAGIVQPIEVIYKGESKTLRFTVLDDSDARTIIDGSIYKGARVDISGASAIEWRLNYPAGPPYTAVVSKSLGGGVSIADQSNPETRGDLFVAIVPGDTASIVAKNYLHDLWITSSGERKCVVRPSPCPVKEPVNGP